MQPTRARSRAGTPAAAGCAERTLWKAAPARARSRAGTAAATTRPATPALAACCGHSAAQHLARRAAGRAAPAPGRQANAMGARCCTAMPGSIRASARHARSRARGRGRCACKVLRPINRAAVVPAPATPGAARAGGRYGRSPAGRAALRAGCALRACVYCPAPTPVASLRSPPRAPTGGFPPPSITARGCPPGVAVGRAVGRGGRVGRCGPRGAACPRAGRRRGPSGGHLAGTACRLAKAVRRGGRLFSRFGGWAPAAAAVGACSAGLGVGGGQLFDEKTPGACPKKHK